MSIEHPGITDEDRKKLGTWAKYGTPNTHDGVDTERFNRYLSTDVSLRLYVYSKTHTNRETADEFDVSQRTVERHRAFWKGGADSEAVQLTDPARIEEPHCVYMREMAHDGASLSEIAETFDCHKRTVHRHVSEKESCQHDHDVSRVSY